MTAEDVAKSTAGLGLPVPRLQLTWVKGEPDGDLPVWHCHYLMVFPVDRWDIRNLGGDTPYTVAPLGVTRSTGGNEKSGRLDTPFRDGVHIRRDAKLFGFPAFVTCGDRTIPVPPLED